ncbi:MAG: SDR family oxidoreductase [Armatimonadetes bacterium]|nr:SDR family oxidoreductase [Armatimonadota bacterium]
MIGLQGKLRSLSHAASQGNDSRSDGSQPGRGIALSLGDEGATVYVTGRTVRGQSSSADRPETIEETAEMVSARGGVGIPVKCDHTVDREIEALFRRVQAEQGRLDLLVNNAWGGYEHLAFGRAVAALASDPNVFIRTGQLLRAGDLAREYGFTDIDGRQPPRFDPFAP